MNAVEGFKVAQPTRGRLAVLAVLLLAMLCAAKTKPRSSSNVTDSDYVSALAVANRFLHAWQTQDHETGVLLLTDTAKQHTSEQWLNDFFSGGDSSDEGFEIVRGKKLAGGRYRFPVVLWQMSAAKERKPHPRYSEIVVVRTGKDDWAIDKLP